MPNQKQNTPVLKVGKVVTRKESNRALLFHTTYDAENKQVEVRTAANSLVGQYVYNGDGKRVKKYVPSTNETTIFVYDASGKMVAEYSTIVASSSEAKVSYLTSDHLGSPRINTDANGQVIARHDYQPFGEEIARTSYGADTVRKKFTAYERDNETDLDYAGARYYSSQNGRFITVDPLMASAVITVTQSWNRYTYALNNPLKYVDPSGELPKDFTAEQTRLFNTYVDNQNKKNNTTLTADEVWNGLNQSQQTTFMGVTHALENSFVTSKDGKTKVKAISLVSGVTQISGELTKVGRDGKVTQDKDGRKQFRLLVELDKTALSKLDGSQEFDKSSNSHIYKGGVVLNGEGTYRQNIADQSIQFSYLTDKVTADIDVDYRAKTSFKHYIPSNSDIRSGENLRRHNQTYGTENPLRNIPQIPK